MPDFFPVARFQLPDDWSPVGTMCVIVRIPDDQQYLGQLIGLLDMLKWSRNFAPDETKTGAATVSRTWEAALETQPIVIRECEMPDFRINEETCLLEVNCDGDWQPVFTPGYDPSTDAPTQTLYPDGAPAGETVECLAAANVTEFFRQGTQQFAALVGIGSIPGAIIAMLYTVLSQLITVVQSQLWLGLGVTYGQLNSATIEADFTAFDWQEFQDLIVCYFEPDGTMTALNHIYVLDELQERYPDSQIWIVIGMVWSLAGSVGVSWATTWAGIVDAECDDCETSWTVTFDAGGLDYVLPYGTVETGGNPDNCGKGETEALAGKWFSLLWVRVDPLTGGTLDRVTCDYKSSTPEVPENYGLNIFHRDSSGADLNFAQHNIGNQAAWTNFELVDAAGWNIAAGDYLIVEIAARFGAADIPNEQYANDSDLRLDNIQFEGEDLF